MNNTAKFLDVIPMKTKEAILANIAENYGITATNAYAEITDIGAEHLLDYVTGPMRAATQVLMAKHKFI